MNLYDGYGLYYTDSDTKIIYWYTYPRKSIFDWPRPENAPAFHAPEDEIRDWCRRGDDWEVVYWTDEPLDSEWLEDLLDNIWWPIRKVVGRLWFKVRRVLVNKMLLVGDWDQQFMQLPNASVLPDHDYAMVDAIYQELVDAYSREGRYVQSGKNKIIESALQKIYDEWWNFERPKWIEALEAVSTWTFLDYNSSEDVLAVMRIEAELYAKFDKKETSYLGEIIKHREMLSH